MGASSSVLLRHPSIEGQLAEHAAAFLAGDRVTTAQWLGAAVVGAAVLAVALRSTVQEGTEATAAAPGQSP